MGMTATLTPRERDLARRPPNAPIPEAIWRLRVAEMIKLRNATLESAYEAIMRARGMELVLREIGEWQDRPRHLRALAAPEKGETLDEEDFPG